MRTPDWMVERIALGELPQKELEQSRARLLAEPDGAERLAALERSNREILSAHPAEQFAAEVERRAHLARVHADRVAARSARRISWPVLLGVPLAAALAVVVLVATPEVRQQLGGTQVVPGMDDARLKGLEPSLHVFRKQGTEVAPLSTGASARAGDVLQLDYARAGRSFGVIVSVDGSGAVTRHLPEAGAQAAKLEGAGRVELPHAYELDAAPAFERFFFVTSDAPFAVSPVIDAARQLAGDPSRARSGPLPLPAPLHQTSLLLLKQP